VSGWIVPSYRLLPFGIVVFASSFTAAASFVALVLHPDQAVSETHDAAVWVVLWWIAAVGGAVPAALFVMIRKAFSPVQLCPAPWQCSRCGYDIRGVKSARCPECGERLDSIATS
jgi:hypothetical protein